MKAVIVDLQGLFAAALCEDGSIRKIEAGSCVIGQTIDLQELSADVFAEKKSTADISAANISIANISSENTSTIGRFAGTEKPTTATGGSETVRAAAQHRRSRHRILSRLAVAAAVCFITVSMGVATVWAMPYGSVCLEEETGASVTYMINRFDYVLDVAVDGENEDAAVCSLNKKKIRHCRIERAVSETLDQLTEGNVGLDESAVAAGDADGLVTGSSEKKSLGPESAETAVEISHGLVVRADLPDRKHAAKVCARLEQVGTDHEAMLEKEQSSQEKKDGSLTESSQEKKDGILPESSQEKENGIQPGSSPSMENPSQPELSPTKKEGAPSETLPAKDNEKQSEHSPAKETGTLTDPVTDGNNTKPQSQVPDLNGGNPDQKENGGPPGQNLSDGSTGSRNAGSPPENHPE